MSLRSLKIAKKVAHDKGHKLVMRKKTMYEEKCEGNNSIFNFDGPIFLSYLVEAKINLWF